jgi:hypothetical protein
MMSSAPMLLITLCISWDAIAALLCCLTSKVAILAHCTFEPFEDEEGFLISIAAPEVECQMWGKVGVPSVPSMSRLRSMSWEKGNGGSGGIFTLDSWFQISTLPHSFQHLH